MKRRRRGAKAVRLARQKAAKQRLKRRAGVLVLAVGAAFGLAMAAVRNLDAAHPRPRAMDHSAHVVAHEHYQAYPRVQEVYRQAAEVPHVLDGIYCYCRCSQHAGHYSLFDCFTSDHGARCELCLAEAAIAYRMTKEGGSLDEVRAAIDALY